MLGMARTVTELQDKVDILERKSNANNVILTGFLASDQKADRCTQIENLFIDELGVETQVQDSYTIGEGPNKPIVAVLENQKQKSLVLQNKKQLRFVKNAEEKGIFVNDYFPPEINQKRQRERQIFNKKKVRLSDWKATPFKDLRFPHKMFEKFVKPT